MRVLYVNPMEGEVNPAIDAIAHGLQHALAEAGHELRMLTADFRSPDCLQQTADAIRQGAEAGVDAVAYYALDPGSPAEAVGAARDRGVPVFSFIRPRFPVNGAVLYPNFNHGVLMGEVTAMRVRISRIAAAELAFNPRHDLAEKIAQIQFPRTPG